MLKPLRQVLTEGFQAQHPDANFSTKATPEDTVKAAVHLVKQDAHGLTGVVVHAEEIVKRLGFYNPNPDLGCVSVSLLPEGEAEPKKEKKHG